MKKLITLSLLLILLTTYATLVQALPSTHQMAPTSAWVGIYPPVIKATKNF